MCHWFPTMDAGCQHCEENFLAVAVTHGLCAPQARSMTLAQVRGGGVVARGVERQTDALWSVTTCLPPSTPVPRARATVVSMSLLVQVLQSHLELPRFILGSQAGVDYGAAAVALQHFARHQELQ